MNSLLCKSHLYISCYTYIYSPVNPKKLNSLQHAVYENDIPKSRCCVAHIDFTIANTAWFYTTIFYWFFLLCILILVKALMREKKRNINKMDRIHGVTSLHLASELGLIEAVGLLLDPMSIAGEGVNMYGNFESKTGNVELKNPQGLTSFLLVRKRIQNNNQHFYIPKDIISAWIRKSVRAGNIMVAAKLLLHGSDVNVTDLKGCGGTWTPNTGPIHIIFASST